MDPQTQSQLLQITEEWQNMLIRRAGMEARHKREQEHMLKEEQKLECKLMNIATSK